MVIKAIVIIGFSTIMLLSSCTTTESKNKHEIQQQTVKEKSKAFSATKSKKTPSMNEKENEQETQNILLKKYKKLHLKKNEIYLENMHPLQIDNYNFQDFSIANATITLLA